MIVSSQVKRNSVHTCLMFLFLQLTFGQTVTVLEADSQMPIPGVAVVNDIKSKTVITRETKCGSLNFPCIQCITGEIVR